MDAGDSNPDPLEAQPMLLTTGSSLHLPLLQGQGCTDSQNHELNSPITLKVALLAQVKAWVWWELLSFGENHKAEL